MERSPAQVTTRRALPGGPGGVGGSPVARVLVDVPLAHLDRPFDYRVPADLDEQAVPGCRVKVRFAGREVSGFVVERLGASDHEGWLAPLRRVVSPEPVLTAQVAALAESVAERYAGLRSDVLRLAVPPRHARVEKEESPAATAATADFDADESAWADYRAGPGFVRRLAGGQSPRAVWGALPNTDWTSLVSHAVAATLAGGRGALVCLPDRHDVRRLDAAMGDLLGPGRHTVLTADLGPAARYRAFLSVVRGATRVVIGTRAAAFAPVRELGLVAIWDDGDDLHAEPRAPYPHAREVLLTRAEAESAGALVGGYARSVEAAYLLRSGWAQEIVAERPVVRARSARVSITGATDRELERDPFTATARLPHSAHEAVRTGLERGPVLVQTPRLGYAAALACDTCRTPARCQVCSGPLQLAAREAPPTCRWCGTSRAGWTCRVCGGRGLRAPVRGERRTAEELGRAFPSVPVRTSAGDRVLVDVEDLPAIVVATPGAEPTAPRGYACVLLLDTWLMLARRDLRTPEESLRRWLNAAALARPTGEGGRVVAVGEPDDPVLQALLRWDPAGFAVREMAERVSAHLPPASRMATLTATVEVLASLPAQVSLPAGAEVLGPVPAPATGGGDAGQRLVVRVPRAEGAALSRALRQLLAVRDAKKLPSVRVQVDPVRLD